MPVALPPKVQQYMVRISKGLPGGMECPRCKEVNTQFPRSLKYRETLVMVYEIIQQTECDQCGKTIEYRWTQDFRHRPSITIPFKET